jgi:tRNA nucleotidyltransferase (CCA-adding enzyme)
MLLPKEVIQISDIIKANGGRLFVVGGAVRDMFRDKPSKDIDLTVQGLSFDQLRSIMEPFGTVVTPSGPQSFPVIKLEPLGLDFALCRRDNRIGFGFANVEFETDGVTIFDDLARRDLTANAIAFDISSGTFIDPHRGIDDITEGMFRAIDSRFAESSERGLRLIQQVARFGFGVDAYTLDQAAKCGEQFDTIPESQIRAQFAKLLLAGSDFLSAFSVMVLTDHTRFFPGIAAMSDIPQDPRHHPEGDVLTHTALTMSAMARLIDGTKVADDDRLVLMAAMLVHDIGKIDATVIEIDGSITSHGHAEVGDDRAIKLLHSIAFPKRLIKRVLILKRFHMEPHFPMRDSRIRKLADELGSVGETIDRLVIVAIADKSGRSLPVEIIDCPEADALRNRAEELAVLDSRPAPLLGGRDLILQGVKPGPAMGAMLRSVREAQLAGEITDRSEALRFLGFE